jgi:hypothetical protein
MPDHFCLYGPPFTLSGELYFSDTVVNFSVDFSNPTDEQSILAYEWYLDDVLVIDERSAGFAGKVYCGGHKIGVRVLSSEGWSGIKNHSFYTCKAPIAIIIQGPDVINEGESGTYLVLQQFSDNSVEDLTNKYTFTVNGGASFNGNVLTTVKNDNSFSDEVLTITATPVTGNPVTKQVTVKNTTQFNSAVLVVDLFNDTSLNVIGLIDNPEVTVNHQSVFTGNNFIPVSVIAENAYMLASDLIPGSSTNWRFEFNLAKLITEYPNTTDFVFYIKGRGAADQGLSGAFSLKTKEAKMTMFGSAGSYVPSVTGGGTVGYSSFSSYSVPGANGSYEENDLFTIIRFNYNVPTDTLTYTIPPRTYLSNPIIEQTRRNNCGAGFVGSDVLYILPYGAFTSTVSQADADAQARIFYNNNKQQYANDHGTCEVEPNYHFKSSTSGSYPVTMTTGYTSGDCTMQPAFNGSMNNQSVLINQTGNSTNLVGWGGNVRMFKVPTAGTYRVKARLTGNIVCNAVGGDADHAQTIRFLFTRTGGSETDMIGYSQNSANGVNAGDFCLPGQFAITKGNTVPFDINFSIDVNMAANEEANFRTRINLFTYSSQRRGAEETNTTNFNFSLLELEIEKL